MPTINLHKASQVSSEVSNQARTDSTALNETYLATFQVSTPLGSYQQEKHPEKTKLNPSFCPKCKMLLRIINSNPSSLRCKKCGYQLKRGNQAVYGGKTLEPHKEATKIAVIDREKASLHTLPIVQAICEKCGKTESETWTVAVGSEGSTSALVFLRCVSCGFTHREVG